ncbi:MAG: nucleotidyltransferase domain-containing protein [Candidatus Nanoarchaeia archaeon]|nr:nucleotidyltransferase domain-containing protein [Candidatus Nanoarchaeia archaeon]
MTEKEKKISNDKDKKTKVENIKNEKNNVEKKNKSTNIKKKDIKITTNDNKNNKSKNIKNKKTENKKTEIKNTKNTKIKDDKKNKNEDPQNLLNEKLESFSKKIQNKLKEQILGIAVIPPFDQMPDDLKEYILSKSQTPNFEKKEEVLKFMENKIQVLITIDDSITELKNKKDKIINNEEALNFIISLKENKDFENINPIFTTKLEWLNNSYIGDSFITRLISFSNFIYEKGFFYSGIKIGEVHKTMVLKKFEKYIVSYVIMGSFMQGTATEKSDFDVMIIVDDTDVQKMTRYELKDKLLNMIYSIAFQAGELTGIKNKLHPQVYILTDFWDSIKNANPVIFSMLRDGIAIYDRGLFLPWKQLLKMGKIKPTRESINMFKSHSHDLINRVETKLRDYVFEDIYYAILNPMQAALMSYGINPTTPRETISFAREFLFNKEKILNEETLNFLDEINKLHKKIEYKEVSKISIDELKKIIESSEKYLKEMDKVFKTLDKNKLKEDYYSLFDKLNETLKEALEFRSISTKDLKKDFEESYIKDGSIKVSQKNTLDKIYNLETKAKNNTLTDVELEFVKQSSSTIIKEITSAIGNEKIKIYNKKLRTASTSNGQINFCQIKNYIYIKEKDNILKISLTKDNKLSKETIIKINEFEKTIKENETKPIKFEVLVEISNKFKNFELL